MADLARETPVAPEMFTDSSAARAIASRRGLGRTRHLEVWRIWIQDAIEGKKVQIKRVDGLENPADPLTKLKPLRDASVLLSRIGVLEPASAPSARC